MKQEKSQMNLFKLIWWPLVLLNAFAFILTGIDKHRSKHNQWRIRESTFFIISAFGGSAGVLMGMYVFRHKTRHPKFVWGIPLILILQVILIYHIFHNGHICL